MKISILCPTLGRAHFLEGYIENLAATTPKGVYTLLFVVDHTDNATRAALTDLDQMMLIYDGTYPEKINAALGYTNEPLVLPSADDVIFHHGWYDHVLAALKPNVHVLGTNDLSPSTSATHSTAPIIRRSYIEDPGAVPNEPGIVFHEGYHHNFAETEICVLAQARGVWGTAHAAVIEHMHPDWGKRAEDSTDLRGNRAHLAEDRALFKERCEKFAV